MSLLPLQLNLPMQQLRKYLRLYLSSSEQSVDDWSSAETGTVKIGDVYTLFKPARLFADNEDMSELQVDGVAVVFREDAGFPMNYFIDENTFEMSFMEGTLSQKASEAREQGLSFYCFHSTLARPLSTEAGTAIGGMHKWGGSGDRLKAPHGLPEPLYFFLTSLGLAVEPTLAREALPINEFVLSLWNPRELSATSRAPNASEFFVPVDAAGQPVYDGFAAGSPVVSEPEAVEVQSAVDYGAMSFSALLDDLSTVPGAADTGNGGNGAPAAEPVNSAPPAETTEQSSLSALLEKVSGVSSQIPPTAPSVSPNAESEDEDESLDLSKLENALKDLVTNQSQPVKAVPPEVVKPAESKPVRKGQLGPQFEDSEGAWEMLKAKPKDEFTEGSPSTPLPFALNVQAAEAGPELTDELDFSAALAAELNQEVNLSLPGAEEEKASVTKGMEPWPSDFAAALKADLAAEEPPAAAPATKGMEPWPSDFAAALKAELAADAPAEKPAAAPGATKGMEPWPSDFAAALKAELSAPESSLSFEQAAQNASSTAGKESAAQGMEPWPSDFAAALAAELSSEINLGAGPAEAAPPASEQAPAVSQPAAASAAAPGTVAPSPVGGGTFAGGLDSLLTASAPSKPSEAISAFEAKKGDIKAPIKKDDKLAAKPASKLDAMVTKQGLSQTNSKLLGGAAGGGLLAGAKAEAQKPGALGKPTAKPESKLSRLSQPLEGQQDPIENAAEATEAVNAAPAEEVSAPTASAPAPAQAPNLTPGFFAASALASELDDSNSAAESDSPPAAHAAASGAAVGEIPSFLLSNNSMSFAAADTSSEAPDIPSFLLPQSTEAVPSGAVPSGAVPAVPSGVVPSGAVPSGAVSSAAVPGESVHNPQDSIETPAFIPETSLAAETAADVYSEASVAGVDAVEVSPEALGELSMGAAAGEFIGETTAPTTPELGANFAEQLVSELGFNDALNQAPASDDQPSSISLEPPQAIEQQSAEPVILNPADTYEDLPAIPAVDYSEVDSDSAIVSPTPQESSLPAAPLGESSQNASMKVPPAKPGKLDFSKSRMFGSGKQKKAGKTTSEEKKVQLSDLLAQKDMAVSNVETPLNAQSAFEPPIEMVQQEPASMEMAASEISQESLTPDVQEQSPVSDAFVEAEASFEAPEASEVFAVQPEIALGQNVQAQMEATNDFAQEQENSDSETGNPQDVFASPETAPVSEAVPAQSDPVSAQADLAAAPAAVTPPAVPAATPHLEKKSADEEEDDESRPQKKLSLQATLSKLEDQSQRAQIRLAEFKESHELACSDDAKNIKVQSDEFEKSINATLLVARESIRNKFQSLVDEASQRLKGLIADGQAQIQGSLPQAHADLDVIAAEANIELVDSLLEEAYTNFNKIYQNRFSSIESDLQGSLNLVLGEELASLKNWREGELKTFTNSFEQIVSRVEQHRIASLSALESCVHSLQEELKRLQEIDLGRLALLNSELGETLEQSCKLAEMRLTRDCDIALAEKIMPLLAEWKSNLGITARNLRIEIEEYLESHSETSLSEFEPVLALGKEAVTLIVSNVSELQENIEGPEKESLESKYQELSTFFEEKISSLGFYFDEQKQKKQDGVTNNESNNAQKIDKIGDTSLGKISDASSNAQSELFKQADNFVDSYDKRAEDICIASIAEMNNDLELARNLRRESLRRLQDRLSKLSSTVQAVQAQLIQ